MTDEEMATATDHELLAAAEIEMKHAKWSMWAACACAVLAIATGIYGMIL